MVTVDFGPPLGLGWIFVPTASGPRSRAHSMPSSCSAQHSGLVHRSHTAAGAAVVVSVHSNTHMAGTLLHPLQDDDLVRTRTILPVGLPGKRRSGIACRTESRVTATDRGRWS